jgi:hypothetical protein
VDTVQELRRKLENVTDPKEYDAVQKAIELAVKQASLQEAGYRKAAAEKAEAERQYKTAKRQAALDKIQELKDQEGSDDATLFKSLMSFFTAYTKVVNRADEIGALCSKANGLAHDLGLDVMVQPGKAKMLGVDLGDGFKELLDRFQLAYRKNGAKLTVEDFIHDGPRPTSHNKPPKG